MLRTVLPNETPRVRTSASGPSPRETRPTRITMCGCLRLAPSSRPGADARVTLRSPISIATTSILLPRRGQATRDIPGAQAPTRSSGFAGDLESTSKCDKGSLAGHHQLGRGPRAEGASFRPLCLCFRPSGEGGEAAPAADRPLGPTNEQTPTRRYQCSLCPRMDSRCAREGDAELRGPARS